MSYNLPTREQGGHGQPKLGFTQQMPFCLVFKLNFEDEGLTKLAKIKYTENKMLSTVSKKAGDIIFVSVSWE